MGSILSAKKRAARADSKKLKKFLEASKKEENDILARKDVIMLAGQTFGSGRRTILNQMKIIHGGGFSSDEINDYRPYIYRNATESLTEILKAMPELGISFVHNELEIDAKMVMDAPWRMESFSKELLAAMKRLWIDLGVQECFALRSKEYNLKYSAKYFLEDLDRLAAKDYQPTEQDILRTKRISKCFDSVNVSLKNLDVILFNCLHLCGSMWGQSRRVYFRNASTMIFCVDMSEYDNKLDYESDRGFTNAMHEDMEFFGILCNTKVSIIILLLNKKDIFKEKLKKSPLTICFPEYTGAQEYEEAAAYIQAKFEAENKSTNKKIFCYKTCAIDTTEIQFVFDAVADVIIANNPKSLRIN